MVVTIAEQACDHVLKTVLKLLIYCSQTFHVKYKHLRSSQLCENQGILGKLITCVATLCLRFLRLMRRPGSSPIVNRNGRKNGGVVENTKKDHTRNIQYKQGLYKITAEELSELEN